MAFQILLNIFLAFLWMFIKSEYNLASFFSGYFFGFVVLFALRRFFSSSFYLYRIFAVFRLAYIFMVELILSNIDVLKVILKPRLDIRPGIFAFPTVLEKDWEITILANLITLTPGTLVVDISDDNKTLYIHAMDINDADESIQHIKATFEKAIMEVSR